MKIKRAMKQIVSETARLLMWVAILSFALPTPGSSNIDKCEKKGKLCPYDYVQAPPNPPPPPGAKCPPSTNEDSSSQGCACQGGNSGMGAGPSSGGSRSGVLGLSGMTLAQVNVYDGRLHYGSVDLSFPIRSKALGQLLVAREYRSYDPNMIAFGPGWSWSLGTRLEFGTASIRWQSPDGDSLLFINTGLKGLCGSTWQPEAGSRDCLEDNGTFWTITRQDGLTYRFDDSTGRLEKVTSLRGEEVQVSYLSGSATIPSQITDPWGDKLTIVAPSGDRILSIQASEGGTPTGSVSYGYDASNRLTSVTDAGGHTTVYGYETQYGFLSQITPPGGQTESFGYSISSSWSTPRVNSIMHGTGPDQWWISYFYEIGEETSAATLTYSNASGALRTESYRWPSNPEMPNRITHRYDTKGWEYFSYNANGWVESEADGKATRTWQYDTKGLRTRFIDGRQVSTAWEFDPDTKIMTKEIRDAGAGG